MMLRHSFPALAVENPSMIWQAILSNRIGVQCTGCVVTSLARRGGLDFPAVTNPKPPNPAVTNLVEGHDRQRQHRLSLKLILQQTAQASWAAAESARPGQSPQ